MNNDWQPISTAPKDGTRILVYNKNFHYTELVYWEGGDWVIFDCSDPFFSETAQTNDLSHWQPLPEPPSE